MTSRGTIKSAPAGSLKYPRPAPGDGELRWVAVVGEPLGGPSVHLRFCLRLLQVQSVPYQFPQQRLIAEPFVAAARRTHSSTTGAASANRSTQAVVNRCSAPAYFPLVGTNFFDS